jgi:hypothetical protein
MLVYFVQQIIIPFEYSYFSTLKSTIMKTAQTSSKRDTLLDKALLRNRLVKRSGNVLLLQSYDLDVYAIYDLESNRLQTAKNYDEALFHLHNNGQ